MSAQPDFVFSAKDFGMIYQYGNLHPATIPCQTTDTSRWVNNSALNGNPGGNGPGVIQSPVQIAFHMPGKYIAAAGGVTNEDATIYNWGSFSGSTNLVLLPGSQTNITSLTLSVQTQSNNVSPVFQMTVLGHQGGVYQITTSANFFDWNPAGVVTNTKGIFVFTYGLDRPQRYFRAVLQ